MTSRKIKIENEKEYNATMKKIDALMKKGENKLTNKEAEELRTMALAAESYEEMNLYANDPFFIKKRETAQKLINKAGLPDSFIGKK